VRFVIGEDQALMRSGWSLVLEQAGFEIVAVAGDAADVVRKTAAHQPDLLIADIRMPPTHTDEGLQAAKTIRQRWPEIGLLVLSQHVNTRYAAELLSAGTEGVGYLLKERVSDLEELSSSVTRVGERGSVLDPAVVDELVGRRRPDDNPLQHLSHREREVLALMAAGRSNKAIAERLYITEHTVEKHVKNIFLTLHLPQSPDDHRRVLAVVTYLNAQ
jgi:DNA-binding NarL/FixJ family response regulator